MLTAKEQLDFARCNLTLERRQFISEFNLLTVEDRLEFIAHCLLSQQQTNSRLDELCVTAFNSY